MKWANHYTRKFIEEYEKNHPQEKEREFYPLDSIKNFLREHPDEIRFIIRKNWIPTRATIIRLCNELKEKPYVWKRNKLIHRRVRIETYSRPYRGEIIITYSPVNHILCRYVMRIRTDDGNGRKYDYQIMFGDRETQSIYRTIIERITGSRDYLTYLASELNENIAKLKERK